MGLKLPTWQELSKDEQIPIINLPLNENYIVTGGPGTGKTIMALHRAAKIKDGVKQNKGGSINPKVLFLVYNRTLRQYLEDALKHMGLDENQAITYHKWFYHYYGSVFGEEPPQLRKFENDWEIIIKQFDKLPVEPFIDHLLLDEAQDFPEGLLQILKKISKHVTIFADSQQSIFNATTSDFTNIFDAGRRVYYLTKNYRNTVEIAKIAALFYTGPEGDIPAFSKNRGDKPTVFKCSSYERSTDLISNFADNNPSLSIGVLLPKTKKVNEKIRQYSSDLQKKTRTNVQTYTSDESAMHIDFNADGIKILSYGTAKGLEFDAVFLPEIDDASLDMSDVKTINSIYVATSRAKSKLFFMHTEESPATHIYNRLNSYRDLLNWKQY